MKLSIRRHYMRKYKHEAPARVFRLGIHEDSGRATQTTEVIFDLFLSVD